MKQRMRYVLVLALATGSAMVTACDDDGDAIDDGSAGAGGEPSSAGTKSGGSANGGSSSQAGAGAGGEGGGAAGMSAGGAGAGGTDTGGAGMSGAGAGEAGDGGTAGMGGASDGGVGAGGASGGAAGDGGAGGAGGPQLEYACGSDTLPKKLCSAFVGANCTDPTVCADCVTERTTELADFLASFDEDNQCPACLDKYNEYFQCAVDAFEGGDITSGVECVEDYGADLNFENCVPLQGEANDCHTYLIENECPATWPPT